MQTLLQVCLCNFIFVFPHLNCFNLKFWTGSMTQIEIRYDLGTDLNRFQTIQPSGREMYFYADLELELKVETQPVVEIKFQGQTIACYP